MKEIYIMLSQTGTLVSKSIKLYTKAKYNHASIGIDPDLRVFYSFARRLRYFPLIGGFITEVVDEGMFKDYSDSICIIYALPVRNSVFRKFCSLLNEYKREAFKYKYNLLGFFGVLFNIPFSFKYRNTCAEFVAKMLHESGIYTFNKHFSLVRPDEFPNIPKLRVVFEGRIQDLNKKRLNKIQKG